MYGEETAERQYSKCSNKITQRESEYNEDTENQKGESSKRRKKKSLVEDNNPMFVKGGEKIEKSDSAVPQTSGQPGQDGSKPRIFTNTAVPRFDGTKCWEQHLLVFQAIAKSNGWSPETACLQLFVHLDGEALQVALLVLNRNRECWRDIADELSAYYNTPGKLVVFRRRFENAHRRPGSDPATFATELGILALHGFSDMKEKARDLMVRDKFIASQRSCDLRRHLDGAAPETSILDIVDSCRIWESHGDTEHSGQSLERMQRILPRPSPKISNSGSGVGSRGPVTNSPPRKVDRNMADRELLIRTVLKVVRERQGTDMNEGRDRGQCFSCGFLGHGVNRCTQLNRSFPYLTPGWSVGLRDGEYRVSKPRVDGRDSTRGGGGGRGMVRPGGSASRTISNNNTLDPVGGRRLVWNRPKDDNHGPRWIPDVQGFPVLESLTPDRRDRAVQNCAAVVDEDSEVDPLCRPEGDGSHQAPRGV